MKKRPAAEPPFASRSVQWVVKILCFGRQSGSGSELRLQNASLFSTINKIVTRSARRQTGQLSFRLVQPVHSLYPEWVAIG